MNKFIIIATLLCILTGCGTSKPLINHNIQKDSIRVEIRERVVTLKDTIYLEVPKQTSEIVTPDSTSHLENDYAESDARINRDGSLFHSLETKPQKKAHEIKTNIPVRDSILYKYRYRDKEVKVEVERNYSWWDRIRFYGFYAFIVFLIITYRKNIFGTLIRLFLKK